MKVRCKSGLWGWQLKLRTVYKNLREFKAYDQLYGITQRLGLSNVREAWKTNPTIQGSVIPNDLRII